MNESLRYLEFLDFNEKSFNILYKNFSILYSYDGIHCKKCNLVQGKPNKSLGIKKYYCDCTYSSVHKKMKKEKEKFMIDYRIYYFFNSDK